MKDKAVEPVKYDRNYLREQSESLFGVKPEIIDGVLHDNSQTSFAVSELQGLITTFFNRKVVTE